MNHVLTIIGGLGLGALGGLVFLMLVKAIEDHREERDWQAWVKRTERKKNA